MNAERTPSVALAYHKLARNTNKQSALVPFRLPLPKCIKSVSKQAKINNRITTQLSRLRHRSPRRPATVLIFYFFDRDTEWSSSNFLTISVKWYTSEQLVTIHMCRFKNCEYMNWLCGGSGRALAGSASCSSSAACWTHAGIDLGVRLFYLIGH